VASDVPSSVTDSAVRLSDLRRSQAADATLENLLSTLSAKIQSCTRLAVFAYEAGNEGHPALASAFREVADTERDSFNLLLACLRTHLTEMPASAGEPVESSRR
jgi:rubrerythrin